MKPAGAGRSSRSTRAPVAALGALLLVALSAGCASRTTPTAMDVLERARAVAGVAEGQPATLRSLADCRSPSGPYQTLIQSDLAGRCLFVQIRPDGAWYAALTTAVEGEGTQRDSEGLNEGVPGAVREMTRGHDLHYMALHPETRFTLRDSVREVTFAGEAALGVAFEDALGGRCEWFARRDDLLPLGMRVPDHLGRAEGGVEIRFLDWPEAGTPRLFRRAEILHGGNTFEFDYRSLEIGAPVDTTLPRPDWRPEGVSS